MSRLPAGEIEACLQQLPHQRKAADYIRPQVQAVRLHEDNLEGVLRAWGSTVQGLAGPQLERDLQDLLADQLRKSKRLASDMQTYARDEHIEAPCFTYAYLLGRL